MEAGLVPMKMVCRPHVLSDLLLSRPAIIIIIIIIVVVVVVIIIVVVVTTAVFSFPIALIRLVKR